jgi:hypothetical protein
MSPAIESIQVRTQLAEVYKAYFMVETSIFQAFPHSCR